MLHLDHGSLTGLVRAIDGFRDHTVEPRTFEALEPLRCYRAIAGHGGQIDRRLGISQHLLESRPPFVLGRVTEISSIDGQQIEADEACRCLQRELVDTRGGRMQPHLQCVEIQSLAPGNDDLAIDDAPLWQPVEEGLM